MNTRVYVVTHKEFEVPPVVNRGGYQIIKVGNILSDKLAVEKGYVTDETGDNISEQNPFYCELTAYYWIWKNINDVDITGVVHYRRYFFNYKKESHNLLDDILTETEINDIMKHHKAIMSFKSIKYRGINYYKNKNLIADDWKIIEEVLRSDYPEMMPTFYKCLTTRETVYGNLFIAYKEDFDKYCNWLFDVLNKYDKYYSDKGIERRPRVDGYISENLLWIWSNWYYKEKQIYRLEVRNTEIDNLHYVDYSNSIKGKMLRAIKLNRSTLNFYRALSLLYLRIKR